MKKTTAILLTLALVLSLAIGLSGCGDSGKKQEAIDAFNTTSAAFNEVAALINENADVIDPSVITDFQDMSALLTRYQGILESNNSVTDEEYDTMIEWFGTVQEWSADMQADLEEYLAG